MPKDNVFVNTLVPLEDDIALRFIGAQMRMNRSELVRLAIKEFIERNEDVVKVTTLPGPKGATPVPVVEVPGDSELVRIPESQG
jgi:hypothetical protein